jgi:predicted CoA-binding protein
MNDPRTLLEQSNVIAIVGCSTKPWRDSNRALAFLLDKGYRVYPVNPNIEECEGLKSYPDVASIPEHVDLVNVFRRPDAVPDVVEDAIAAGADAIWLQLGVGNAEAERRASEAGLKVVSERCIMVDYRLLGIVRS